jgi:hypothetical protein
MNFQPKTVKELQQESERLLLPARKEPYPATVESAVDKTSKSGNEMIEIKLKVFADDGSHRTVTDYLMEAMAHKLFHFAEATGNMDKYESGTLSSNDCEGKELFVKIGIDPANGNFAAKNVVKDYVSPQSELKHAATKEDAPKAAPKSAPKPPKDSDLDIAPDDIPFAIPFAPFVAGLGAAASLFA